MATSTSSCRQNNIVRWCSFVLLTKKIYTSSTVTQRFWFNLWCPDTKYCIVAVPVCSYGNERIFFIVNRTNVMWSSVHPVQNMNLPSSIIQAVCTWFASHYLHCILLLLRVFMLWQRIIMYVKCWFVIWSQIMLHIVAWSVHCVSVYSLWSMSVNLGSSKTYFEPPK